MSLFPIDAFLDSYPSLRSPLAAHEIVSAFSVPGHYLQHEVLCLAHLAPPEGVQETKLPVESG